MTEPRYVEFKKPAELVTLVKELYRRLRRSAPRPRTPPIIVCVQPERDPTLLSSVAKMLAPDEQHRIPHAMVTVAGAGGGADEVIALRELLCQLVDELAMKRGGGYPFPHFLLVHWLMDQKIDGATPNRVKEVRRRLRHRALNPLALPDDVAADVLPGWVRALGFLLTPLYFRVLQSGTVPRFGRRYRWFLRRQPNLAPKLHRSFFDLAERLVDGQWQRENAEQVRRLLVNAFLEDLRRSFRGIGWVRRYRTTVPIVLLDNLTMAGGGETFVRTVGAVRNESGVYDPLLLVTAGSAVPGFVDLQPETVPPGDPDESLLDRWRERLPGARRKRDEVAWIIVGRLPRGGIPPSRRPLEPGRPPWLRRRWVAAALAAAVIGGYAWAGYAHSATTCGRGFTWLGVEPVASDVTRVDDACIGVTDGSDGRLPYGTVLGDVAQKINEHNERALEVHDEQPERPLVTLVLMAAIDPPPGAGDEALAAVREQMAGMAVVQDVQLRKPPQPYEPLIRVLIANVGPQLQHGVLVAEQLGRMAAADPGIVAVIGPNQSRAATAETLAELGAVGLPTVSAVLTADSMVDASRLYFGIAPQNSRQAAVTAAYVNQLLATGQQPTGRPLARSARIYMSDDAGDSYSQSLAEDLHEEFGQQAFEVETVAFTPIGFSQGDLQSARHVTDASIAGREACDFDGVVLYAARGKPDFQAFLDGVADRCRDRPPYIIGGSDVTTYVADRDVSGANRSIPFEYLSHALAPELGGEVPVQARDFYARLYELFPWERSNLGRSLDGYAALTYDAAYTTVAAIGHLARERIAITGSTVWPALMSVTDAAGAQRRYQGVSGTIDFGGTVERRIPVNKPVSVVGFADGAPSAARNIICAGPDDPLTQPWCPFDP